MSDRLDIRIIDGRDADGPATEIVLATPPLVTISIIQSRHVLARASSC